MTNFLKSLSTLLLLLFTVVGNAQRTDVTGVILKSAKNQPLFVVDGIIVDNSTNILKRLL